MIFLFVRVIYTLVGTFDSAISPYSGKIVYRAVLGALMEYLASITLSFFGVMTREIKEPDERRTENGLPLQERSDGPPKPTIV